MKSDQKDGYQLGITQIHQDSFFSPEDTVSIALFGEWEGQGEHQLDTIASQKHPDWDWGSNTQPFCALEQYSNS